MTQDIVIILTESREMKLPMVREVQHADIAIVVNTDQGTARVVKDRNGPAPYDAIVADRRRKLR